MLVRGSADWLHFPEVELRHCLSTDGILLAPLWRTMLLIPNFLSRPDSFLFSCRLLSPLSLKDRAVFCFTLYLYSQSQANRLFIITVLCYQHFTVLQRSFSFSVHKQNNDSHLVMRIFFLHLWRNKCLPVVFLFLKPRTARHFRQIVFDCKCELGYITFVYSVCSYHKFIVEAKSPNILSFPWYLVCSTAWDF